MMDNLFSLFSWHVSPQVLETVWEQREQFLDKGRWWPQALLRTTFIADLERFSGMAEKIALAPSWEWLNLYRDSIVKIISNHGGLIDDYYGDMIKTGFGVLAIEQTEEHIRDNVSTVVRYSVAMEQEMVRFNAW